jgi:hypothetical protein
MLFLQQQVCRSIKTTQKQDDSNKGFRLLKRKRVKKKEKRKEKKVTKKNGFSQVINSLSTIEKRPSEKI